LSLLLSCSILLSTCFLIFFYLFMLLLPPPSTLFPYTTLFRSPSENDIQLTKRLINAGKMIGIELIDHVIVGSEVYLSLAEEKIRSEEHTSELQSRFDLVCRLLLEKKK